MEAKRRRTERLTAARAGPSSVRGRNGGGWVDKMYNFKVVLSDGAALGLRVRNPPRDMPVSNVLDRVKEKFNSALEKSRLEPAMMKRRRKMWWRGKDVYLVGERMVAGCTTFKNLEPSKCYLLSQTDVVPSATQSQRDLTPDAGLFYESRHKYDTESALAELIDKSICAVCSRQNKRLVSLDVNEDCISILDTGDGINECGVNSYVKWGSPIPNLDTLSRGTAPRGRPPYFKSILAKLGYGGYKASLHLGRHTLVSSKTKESNDIYMLHFGYGTLHEKGDFCWKLLSSTQSDSDVIDSFLGDVLGPCQRSFTRVEVFDHVYKVPDKLLPSRIKDIYFPFIQSDDSAGGTTRTIVTFQVNGVNLAELEGGQVATMNLHSSNGPEFVLQLHFSMDEDRTQQSKLGAQGPMEANACLKCVYFPAIKGKEGIENILKNESFKLYKSDNFSHVYVRWLGRLLTEAQWNKLPFMEPRPKIGNNYQVLKRCYRRVICFVDTDGGFISTPVKTNLCEDHPFTKALKNLGACVEQDVNIMVSGKQLNLQTLEMEYKNWVFRMHDRYDIENYGIDEPVHLVDPSNIEELKLSSSVVRVHKFLERGGKTWKYGQPVKILKGTCPGYTKTNLYATLEYFLLEGLEGDAGGEASFTCRPYEVQENEGCVLRPDGNPTLDLRLSLSLPISVIDSGKCLVMSIDDWNHEIKSRRLAITKPNTEKQSIKRCQDLMSDVGNSSPISFKKRSHAKTQSGIRQWKLLKCNGQPFVARMGSCFPPFSVAGYDIDENCVPFDFAPEVSIKVESENGLMCQVDKFIPELSLDKQVMNVENLHIKSCDIDKLRPSYVATLFMCKSDNSLELQVPCKLMPGPLDQVVLLYSKRSIELHPGYVFKDLTLEMLDAYGNHVEEGCEVTLSLDGIQMLDYDGLNFKADSQGYIDLSGRLKVTGGYGKSVSLSVLFINKVVFKEEFQIVKRELRMSEVPEKCLPGSILRNLVFEVINSDGMVDENVHDQNKDGFSHLLRIDVQLQENVRSELFPFQLGKCTVPAITLPTEEGCCWLVATHSDHVELCKRFKVMISQVPQDEPPCGPCNFQSSREKHDPVYASAVKVEHDTVPYLPCPGDELLMITPQCDSVSVASFDGMYAPLMVNNVGAFAVMNLKNLEKEIDDYGIQIRENELELRILSSRKDTTMKDLTALRAYGSKKEQMEKLIESKVDSLTAYHCYLSRTMGENNNATNLLSLVALLGTAPCSSLAKMLAVYLGEDQMLAVVCKSTTGETFRNCENLLDLLKARSGIGQQLYICLKDLRPFTGEIIVGDDQQRRLAIPDPMLDSGMAPLGFRGYAVNLIDINLKHVNTRIGVLGLRETLFYHLFGELQVYESREHMRAAWSCIQSGAVSLDGWIMKGNGTMLLSFNEPEICFPVLSLDQPLDLSSGVTDINRHVEAKMSELGNLSAAVAIKEHQLEIGKKVLNEKLAQYYQMLDPLKSLCKNGSFINSQEARALYNMPSPGDLLPEKKPEINSDDVS